MSARVLIFLLLVLPALGEPTTYWTAATGGTTTTNCATASGTSAPGSFIRTINAGIVCLTSAGDILKVRNGTYNETVTFGASSGTSGNPKVVEAENARQAIWAATGSESLVISGVSWVTIRGMVFDGTNGTWGAGSMSAYTALSVTGAERNVQVTGGATDIRFENNEFRQAAYGFAFVAANAARVTFSGNFIHHTCKVRNCNVLYAGAPNTVFESNTVEDTAGPMALWNQGGYSAHNGIFRNNIFRRNGVFWSTQNGTVQCCATGACPGGSEGLTCSQRMPQGFASLGGGIYISSGDGTLAYNNVFEPQAAGLTANHGATNCGIYNNTHYGNTSDAAKMGDGGAPIFLGDRNNGSFQGATGCSVRNNLVYQPTVTFPPPMVRLLTTGNSFSNNLCSTAVTGLCSAGDPMFVDPNAGNLQLQAGSPAINAGATVSQVSTDILGISRPQGLAYDLGAYEFTAVSNTYSVSRNLATVAAGQPITFSWTVTPGPGQVKDWVGMTYAGGSAENYITTDGIGNPAWTFTNGALTGNYTFIAPSIADTFEFVYCINDTYICPVRSAPFTITTTVGASGFLVGTARWHQSDQPEATDVMDPQWIESELTAGTAALVLKVRPGARLRYRVGICYKGPQPPPDYLALYCHVGDASTYDRVEDTYGTLNVRTAADSAVNMGQATTRLLSLQQGCTIDQPGRFVVDAINTAATVQANNLQQFDMEYGIDLSPDLQLGTLVRCRPQHNNGSITDFTYLVQPALQLYEGALRLMGGRITGGLVK